MAYIGNTQVNQNYVAAIDYFSGNGSTTAFTLSRPVASVAQVQVVIENVPQNPGDAYTVNGNTITFTSAPPSGTNNIYVYYTSPNTQVTALPQSPVVYGNLNFGSTGARIQGDFSNATVANRVAFQTSTVDSGTTVSIIPNGTSQAAQFLAYNNSTDLANASWMQAYVGSDRVQFGSGRFGTGTYLPMTFNTSATERMRITTNGGVAFGGASNYGTSGQVLKSNGDAAPSWITLSSGFTSMDVFTSGTGTWTIPAGITQCKITVVGGGGGGGASTGGAGNIAAGAGGGGGGASIRYYTGLTPGNTISYTVGGAGGGGSSGNNGSGGGTSSVSSGTQTITSISATGGGGGTGSNTGTVAGSGGAGSGGTVNISGCAGVFGVYAGTRPGGAGGSSIFGGGGLGGSSAGTNGSTGGSYGGGGGGGGTSSIAGNVSGGAGAAGVVIIEY